MFISKKVKNICPSPTLEMNAKAKQMKQKGHDIIGFTAGEPDFDTPEYIKLSAIKAINQDVTKYTPVGGMPELKIAIANYLETYVNTPYTLNQIMASNGAKQCLFNALYCLIDPGDEILIPSPYWVSYPEMVKLCKGIPVFVPTFEDSDFVLKADILKNYINKKTKALILNNPNNPCGCVYTKQDLEEIAKLAIKNNIFVISDEIYDRLIYDNTKHISIASFMDMPERTLLVNGVSKSFAMTGWRIGFAAGPSQLIEVMESLQSHSTSNPNSIAQKASIEALTYYAKDEILSTMVAEFSKRRKYMVNKINSMNNMSCRLPKGAFYVFVNISKTFGKKCDGKTINNSIEFAELLLEKYKVAVVPGIAFGDNNYVRLSYATSMANIKKGLERIEEFDKILK